MSDKYCSGCGAAVDASSDTDSDETERIAGVSVEATDGTEDTQSRGRIARWRRYVGWTALAGAIPGLGWTALSTVVSGSLPLEGLAALAIVVMLVAGQVWIVLFIIGKAQTAWRDR